MVIYLEGEKFSYNEVYQIINRLLNFVNVQIQGNGEFGLKYMRDNTWMVKFDNEDEITRKAKEESQKLLKKTADFIEEISGNRPV